MYGVMLKELRKSYKYTQLEIAKVFGYAQTTVGMWEREEREPDIDTLSRLAEFYNVSVDYIVNGRTDIKPQEKNSTEPIEMKQIITPPGYLELSANQKAVIDSLVSLFLKG